MPCALTLDRLFLTRRSTPQPAWKGDVRSAAQTADGVALQECKSAKYALKPDRDGADLRRSAWEGGRWLIPRAP